MMHSEQLDKLAEALAKAQGELEDAGKTKAAHGYKYADLGAVLNMIRPVFSRHGLSVSQTIGRRLEDGNVSVTTILLHESGQWIKDTASAPVVVPVGRSGQPTMTDIQATGSITTYLRRYSLAAIAGLTQIDDDGQMREDASSSQSYGREQANLPQCATQAQKSNTAPSVRLLEEATGKELFSLATKMFGRDKARAELYARCRELGIPENSSQMTEQHGLILLERLKSEGGAP